MISTPCITIVTMERNTPVTAANSEQFFQIIIRHCVDFVKTPLSEIFCFIHFVLPILFFIFLDHIRKILQYTGSFIIAAGCKLAQMCGRFFNTQSQFGFIGFGTFRCRSSIKQYT